jgi:hypothetical protein
VRLAADREVDEVAGAAAPILAGGEDAPSQELSPSVQARVPPESEVTDEARDRDMAQGRPLPTRGRPKRACAKRPMLTVCKGLGKRRGSK